MPAQLEIGDMDRFKITLLESVQILVFRAFEPLIIFLARAALFFEWRTFHKDQGTNPFSRKSRLRVRLDGYAGFFGLWGLSIYWNPENEDYHGMSIEYEYFLCFPYSCNTGF